MKVSLNWLSEYVDIDVPVSELCEKLTMAGFEIEGVEDQSIQMSNVVVGRIEKIEKHPNADKLLICQVNTGNEVIQIVTGADNVFEGAVIPVALHNSKLPNGLHIKSGKLRGVESNGMLCSGEELCLTEADFKGAGVNGILILDPETKIGTDMRELVGKGDCILDISITANRPDCLSVLGIAREVAAILNKPLKMPDVSYTASLGDINDVVSISVEDFEKCPRYIGKAVKNVKIGPSPKWLCDFLNAAGMRPISNIVDITNFVMLETGQPMHAFDMRDVSGRKIIVRTAKDGEKLVTLDEKEHVLSDDMLVIADSERAIGLAGIMGGLNSEIKPDTTEILFECAKFARDNVRRTARSLGILTESSLRFEKGIDIQRQEFAINRALHLVQQLGIGDIVCGGIDLHKEFPAERTVMATVEKINSILGIEIDGQTMADILNRLQISTTLEGNTLICKVPAFREDIENANDLAEEIIRIYGYDHIVSAPLVGEVTRGCKPVNIQNEDQIKSMLVSFGYNEIITYSFISNKALDMLNLPADDERRNMMRLINPLSEDYSCMRTQMVHNMLNVLSTNYNNCNAAVKLFESGRVYVPKALPINELPKEIPTLCISSYGSGDDFFSFKGVVESIVSLFSKDIDYIKGQEPFLHPGRQAVVTAGKTPVAFFGEVHPVVAERYKIGERVYIAQINVEELTKNVVEPIIFKPLPKYPAIDRDLAVVLDENIPVGDLMKAIRSGGGNNLKAVELFDIYRSEAIGEGKKSVAFALTFRSDERTLTQEEVAKAFDKIVRSLEYRFGASLR